MVVTPLYDVRRLGQHRLGKKLGLLGDVQYDLVTMPSSQLNHQVR